MPALYSFVIIRLRHTPHGVGCLVCHHERTRLTLMTVNRAMIIRCKYTKKMITATLFVNKLFTQTFKINYN